MPDLYQHIVHKYFSNRHDAVEYQSLDSVLSRTCSIAFIFYMIHMGLHFQPRFGKHLTFYPVIIINIQYSFSVK